MLARSDAAPSAYPLRLIQIAESHIAPAVEEDLIR
jgi:hypothetical protein